MNESRSFELFRRAVLDLSDEPTAVNVRRYLAASRILDRPAGTAQAPATRRRRTAHQLRRPA